MAPAPDAGDPPGLRQQAMQLFETFVRLLDEAPAERQHTTFVMQLRELDLLKVGNVGLTLQASVRRLLLSGLKAQTLPCRWGPAHSCAGLPACMYRRAFSLR